MSVSEHLVALEAFASELERHDIAYVVAGSVASSAWGRGRSTVDVDLVVDLRPEHVDVLMRRCREAFYLDDAMMRDAIRTGRSFNIVHLETMIKIDIFVRGQGDYDREVFEASRRVVLDRDPAARSFPVTAPEDIVLRKLAWFRAGGETSERQWSDVLDVLRVQAGDMDRARMRRRAPELGIDDLLERALGAVTEDGPTDG